MQWCRDNIATPLDIRHQITLPGESGKEVIIIVGTNFSFLATIGDFIKNRAVAAGHECQIIEKPKNEIQAHLDNVAKDRIISVKTL